MSYSPLPIVEVDLKSLRLDLDNYRIPTRREDESAALRYLFASEDVLGSATEIIRDGYFDNEVPVVIEGDDGYIVLEGNRRVSALKTLSNPDLAPVGAARTGIDALLVRYEIESEDLPERIRVMVAPSRDIAAPYIARLHTGRQKRQWTTDQQATYYYSLLGPEFTYDDLRAAYPGVDIGRNIRRAVVRRFLSGVRFTSRDIKEYVTGPDLKMSSFEYAFRTQAVASLIGLEFDAEGQLIPRSKEPEAIGKALKMPQREALEMLVRGFKTGKYNTRSAEFKKGSDAQEELLQVLSGAPEPEPLDGSKSSDHNDEGQTSNGDFERSRPKDGEVSGSSEEDTRGNDSESSQPGSRRGPNHPDTKDRLDLTGLHYDTHLPVTYQHRYQELRKCSLNSVPIATAVLLRSVLEVTIKFHFANTATPATGELKQCMHLVNSTYGGGKVRSLRSAIGQINSGDKPGSVTWFNSVAHNGDTTPSISDIHEAFKLVSPLLRHLLTPPATP